MPSTPRIASSVNLYHIMARGVGRSIIFEDDADRARFVQLLDQYHKAFSVPLHAWCLMDNHYHLLAEGSLDKISKMMRRVNSRYALYFNERYGRSGHLFQGRYKSEPIESDEYYLTVLRYIHQNPMRAGISETCSYPWSSFDGYVSNPRLVSNTFAMSLLRDEEEFRLLHDELDETSTCIDVGRGRNSIAPEEMIATARAALPDVRLEEIVGLNREARDACLRALKSVNLSTRQIELLTGVSRSVVSKA